ncbi:MAG: hypothetical protein LBC80_05395 [Treponema sp.]|jgi:hypothetical protein|nr:hypothetical protein [Treponema sp.]
MSNEPEWRNANPSTENLPGKGKVVIQLIFGGIALLVLAIAGRVIRPLGLGVGGFAFVSGILMLLRRRQLFYKPGLIVTVCGFLLLLSTPRFGVVAGFASFFVVATALGLVVFGLINAIKLAFDVQK